MMYLLGVFIYVVFLILISAFSSPDPSLLFVDLPSLLVILALTIPMLMASGLMSDFLKGFRLMGSKANNFSKIELIRILEADKLAVKSLFISGAIGTAAGTISLFSNVTDVSGIGRGLSVAILTLLYSLIIISIVLPIKAKVTSILKTSEQENIK